MAALAVLVGAILGWLGLCALLAWRYLHPGRTVEGATPPGFTDLSLPGPGYGLPAWANAAAEQGTGERIAVLVHGYGGDRTGWAPVAERLSRAGFAVVVPAMRAHGANPARRVGFGPEEAREVRAAVDWARSRRGGRPARVVAAGISLGGAAVWRAAREADAGIDAVATEGTFADLDPTIDRWFDAALPGGRRVFWPVRRMAEAWSGLRPATVRPVDDAAAWRGRPALVIHGAKDRLVPAADARTLARAAGAELWIVPDSRHAHAARDAADEFAERLVRLLD